MDVRFELQGSKVSSVSTSTTSCMHIRDTQFAEKTQLYIYHFLCSKVAAFN